MALGPILALATAGLVLGVLFVFWAMLQNWMAEVIHRARERLGKYTYTLQSALVILDRVIVNGQRLVIATGRALFRENQMARLVTVEEVRPIEAQALPADVLARLDAGQSLTYDLSDGSVSS
jgi:hypothetical protein